LGPWDARQIATVTGQVTIPHVLGRHFRLDIELPREYPECIRVWSRFNGEMWVESTT
jgi:hypothetical protein